jgi:hypothetical protein
MGPPSADQHPAGSSRAAGCGSDATGNAHCEEALVKLTRFRGARQAFNGGFSDAQDASALFT